MFDFIFPKACVICGKPLGGCDSWVHKDCRQLLLFVEEPFCYRCGKPLSDKEKCLCRICTSSKRFFDGGRCTFHYNSAIARSIKEFKNIGIREYSDFYARAMVEKHKDFLRNTRASAIVPVPIHRQKYLDRGFNQAELIADDVAGYMGLPMIDMLEKTVKTQDQKELDRSERRRNLAWAFKVYRKFNGLNIPLSVILIDDIYTTGSTMDACAEVLKEAGVKEVFFMCVAAGAAE